MFWMWLLKCWVEQVEKAYEVSFAQCEKYRNFSVIQILREIKIGESKVLNSAILPHLDAWFFHFMTAEIYQINKI